MFFRVLLCQRRIGACIRSWLLTLVLQAIQSFNKLRVIFASILLGGLYFSQHYANGIHHRQQPARKFRREREFPVPKAGEKALSHMSDFLQLGESQKAATSFNCMDGPEDARQKFL